MNDVVITVEDLGKKYRIRHESERYTALRDVISNKAKNLFRRNGGSSTSDLTSHRAVGSTEPEADLGPLPATPKPGEAGTSAPTSDLRSPSSELPRTEDFWALKDVSFEVRRGEVLGIIGRNGAGKTTLLKILSRITEPTEGRVRIKGRVASLLEVGTGFHPELTGRENIYLNGAILGMSRAEIKKKFDEIVAFAETEKFLDTPVKRYSSGMYVRLAFAVAAHLEPEILVVDEVLAVGDAEFQKKCLGKMEEVSRGGRTVLFVSHNMGAMKSLCDRGLILVAGSLKYDGPSSGAVAKYSESEQSATATSLQRLSQSLVLKRFDVTPALLHQHEPLVFTLEVAANSDEVITDFAIQIESPGGGRASLIDLRSPEGPYKIPSGASLLIRSEVRNLPYVEGDFSVGFYINAGSVCNSFMNLAMLGVLPAEHFNGVVPRHPQFRGVVELQARVESQIA